MRIDMPESQVAGTYADGVRTSYNKWGFVLDFIVRDDRTSEADVFLVVDRVRLDPSSVQAILGILSEKLDEYEKQYGDPRQ